MDFSVLVEGVCNLYAVMYQGSTRIWEFMSMTISDLISFPLPNYTWLNTPLYVVLLGVAIVGILRFKIGATLLDIFL